MAATHKGAISFGLVHIPVALHTATQDNDIHFNCAKKTVHVSNTKRSVPTAEKKSAFRIL